MGGEIFIFDGVARAERWSFPELMCTWQYEGGWGLAQMNVQSSYKFEPARSPDSFLQCHEPLETQKNCGGALRKQCALGNVEAAGLLLKIT